MGVQEEMERREGKRGGGRWAVMAQLSPAANSNYSHSLQVTYLLTYV